MHVRPPAAAGKTLQADSVSASSSNLSLAIAGRRHCAFTQKCVRINYNQRDKVTTCNDNVNTCNRADNLLATSQMLLLLPRKECIHKINRT